MTAAATGRPEGTGMGTETDVTIPLAAGGALRVIRCDHARHGWVYLAIEGAIPPDADGVASLDDAARRALIVALAEGEPDNEGGDGDGKAG